MRVKLTTKLTNNIGPLTPTNSISLNEKIIFFLKEGYEPDEYGYLHKGEKYIKLVETGITIVNKNQIWKKGIAIDRNINLLNIRD